jgi:TPR repeat protein
MTMLLYRMLAAVWLVLTASQLAIAVETADPYRTSVAVAKEIEALKAKAERGDADSQCNLGFNYINGIGVTQDDAEAVKWFRKAADQGDAKGQHLLGWMYAEGQGVTKDDVEALKWYRKAAEQGNVKGQVSLGIMYNNGEGVTKDHVEAVKWFRKAADQGDAKGQHLLGWMYAEGQGVTKDEVEAVKWYRKAAEWYHKAAKQNNAYAQFNLGLLYANGEGVTKDEDEAVKWYHKAAEQNFAEAQYFLGLMYASGSGVTKDESEAAKWWSKAAEQGNANAQYNLGTMYANGNGVEIDSTEAFKWYQKAAKQGHTQAQNSLKMIAQTEELKAQAEKGDATAQYRLGTRYRFGFPGVMQDDAEAEKWFRKSADQGNAEGQDGLGFCYRYGLGVTKDDVEAVKWFRKAAEQGYDVAQYNLGYMYYDGECVPKDYVQSYKWQLLATSHGNEPAKKLVSFLEKNMTLEQIAEGQKLAREFKPRNKSQSNVATRENVDESRPEATGSGFFITDDGYFITNQHVAGLGATVRVLTASDIISAKVIKVDALNDLTLLKAEGKFAALPVTLSRGVQLGATVATVGFPNIGLQGFSPKLAKGEIASLAGIQDDARHFQISVPVQPGNSGGALVDERGNVIGVVVAKLSQKAALATSGSLAENVNYAIKSSYLLSFLESVPEVAAKLKEPNTMQRDFETTIKDVEQAAVLVLVY